MCDRGEYLLKGHRETAMKLSPLTSYAPPYRGDMKGLVEVLHRIEKDAQLLFVPGENCRRRQEFVESVKNWLGRTSTACRRFGSPPAS